MAHDNNVIYVSLKLSTIARIPVLFNLLKGWFILTQNMLQIYEFLIDR